MDEFAGFGFFEGVGLEIGGALVTGAVALAVC
jgi:hypothetical protein